MHYTRASDLIVPDHLMTTPAVPIARTATDSAIGAPGSSRRRAVPSVRRTPWSTTAACPTRSLRSAPQHPVAGSARRDAGLLLGSRYCETDRLTEAAWQLFGATPLGWARVQAICDFVHHHIQFGYEHARPTKTAWEAFRSASGVCRDYAHLAIAFAAAMNIPARYCTGYLGDIGMPPPYGADGLRRLVRGLSRRRLAHLRSPATTCRASAAC